MGFPVMQYGELSCYGFMVRQMLFLPCRFVGVNCRKEPVYVEPFLLLLRTSLPLPPLSSYNKYPPPPPFIVDSSLLSNKANHEFFFIFFLFSLIQHDNWIFLPTSKLKFHRFSAQNYCCYIICSSYLILWIDEIKGYWLCYPDILQNFTSCMASGDVRKNT